MVVLPELSSPMIMIFIYFLPASLENTLPKNPPIIITAKYREEKELTVILMG